MLCQNWRKCVRPREKAHTMCETNGNIPGGGVYLCQISETVSCGACCGLYNVADTSREALEAMLIRRTETFETVPRNLDAILAFKQETESLEDQERPFPEFHHCPYIGLIGESRSRVGCLLHPLGKGNKGVDFRGLSFYGGMACRIYFCPSYRKLPGVYKSILRDIADDWYLHGLVITEVRLLNAFFQELEKRLGISLTREAITENQDVSGRVRDFLQLKIDWPFRSPAHAGAVDYFFEDQLYPKPPINYDEIGVAPSQYDTILREMRSAFDSPDALNKAENLLDQLFDHLIQSLR